MSGVRFRVSELIELTPDTRHLKPFSHRYHFHFSTLVQSLCVDIDFNQSVGVDHGADKTGFTQHRIGPESAIFNAKLNPNKIDSPLPRGDISA